MDRGLGPGSSWRTRYPHAGALLTQPIQTQLIADHWNDLLRLVGSMKFRYATASLLIAKLHASSRQNSLARALQEYGRLVRTIYLCRYVADEELRRRVRRQLNKGESLHALRRHQPWSSRCSAQPDAAASAKVRSAPAQPPPGETSQ